MKNNLFNILVASFIIALPSFTFAQSCDTLRNYVPTDDLFQLSANPSSNGFIWGHNLVNAGTEQVTGWAEAYSVAGPIEVRRLTFVPWKVRDGGGSVTFSLRNDNLGVPGTTVLATESLTLASLTENVIEYVDFATPAAINGNFWVVMEMNYSNANDSIALLGTYQVGGGPNTTYINTAGFGWEPINEWYALGVNDKVRWRLDVLVSNDPAPVADFDFNQNICINGQFNVDGSTSQNTTDYFWILGNNPFTEAYDTNNGINATLEPTISGGNQAIYLVADGSCMTDVIGYVVFVDPAVSATVTAANEICGQGNGSITISNPQGGFGTYEYSIDGVNYVTTSTFNGLPAGPYTVYVRTGGDGCEESYNVTINETLAQQITMGAAQTSCAGSPVTISASGLGNIEWFEGMSSLGVAASISVSPTLTTTYTAVLTDANGCTSNGNLTVTVNALPIVSASADQTICVGDNAAISVTGNAVTYTWNNGLGNGTAYVVSPATTTTYEVTGVDGNNCENSAVVVINVNQIDNATFTFNNFCEGSPNQATNIVLPGGNFDFNPAPGDGATINASTGGITNGVLGTTYSVEYTTNGACPSSSIQTVTVQSSDDASFVFNNICIGTPALPSGIATTGGSFDFLVTPTDGATINTSTGEILNPVAGNSYQVEYTTPSGVCQSSEVVTVSAFALPTVSASADQTICDGENVIISANGAVTYSWDNGLGAGDTHSVSPAANTTYTVVGTDGNGCAASDVVNIVVNPTPTVGAGNDATICEGDEITLTANNPDGAVISWNNGVNDGVAFTPTNGTLTYIVSADLGGCIATDEVDVTVNILPTVSMGTDEEMCDNVGILNLAGTPTGGIFSGPGVTGDEFNPLTAGVGIHTLTYTFEDANGCSNSSTAIYTVDDCASLIENSLSNSLVLAPNPSSTFIDIEISGNDLMITSIRLISLEGRVLEIRNNSDLENTIRLDVSSYAKGTYMAIIVTSRGDVAKKFIVQ
jgi:hypothetical protein